MFDHIINRRARKASTKEFEISQSNVLPTIKVNGTPAKMTQSNASKASQNTDKKTDPREMPKRLKLKDYIRLNEISKQKRSRSAECLKLQSKQKLNNSKVFDIRHTFGIKQEGFVQEISASKIESKPYSQETALQRFQLMNVVKKVKEKFTDLISLIEETSEKLASYNDLVFMFQVEQTMNDYIKKGIQTIASAYKEHFIAYPHQGMDNEMVNLRISHIISMRNIYSPQKFTEKTEKKNLEDLNGGQDEKFKNLKVLPVSLSITDFNNQTLVTQKSYPLFRNFTSD